MSQKRNKDVDEEDESHEEIREKKMRVKEEKRLRSLRKNDEG